MHLFDRPCGEAKDASSTCTLFEEVIIGCRAFRGRERFDDPIEKSAPRLMEPLQGERVSFFDKESGDAEARRRPPHSRFLR